MSKQQQSLLPKTAVKATKSKPPKKTLKIKKEELRTRLLSRQRRDLPHQVRVELPPSLFVDSIEPEYLTCNICMELLMMPFSLKCGHTFCFSCLDSLSQHPSVCNSCPCCRGQIGDDYPSRNRTLEKLIPFLLTKLPEQEKTNYWARKKKMLEGFEQRAQEYRGVTENMKIDFKVGNHWEVGKVIRIYEKEGKRKIEVQANESQLVYVFSDYSTHLALYRSFSQEVSFCIDDFLMLDSNLSISGLWDLSLP